MERRNKYPTVLLCGGISVVVMYALVMILGYYFYAQYTQIPVSLNIGNDFFGKNLKNGNTLRIIAALGIIFNVQVSCPLITFPIRDMLYTVLSRSTLCSSCMHRSSEGGDGVSQQGGGKGNDKHMILPDRNYNEDGEKNFNHNLDRSYNSFNNDDNFSDSRSSNSHNNQKNNDKNGYSRHDYVRVNDDYDDDKNGNDNRIDSNNYKNNNNNNSSNSNNNNRNNGYNNNGIIGGNSNDQHFPFNEKKPIISGISTSHNSYNSYNSYDHVNRLPETRMSDRKNPSNTVVERKEILIKNCFNLSRNHCTFFILLSAMIIAIYLRLNFLSICSMIGSVATITNSLLLPLIFYHRLTDYKNNVRTTTFHVLIFLIAIFVIIVGAGGNVCSIFHFNKSICYYLISH